MTSNDKAKLERLLNRALSEYAKAEPRSGLERRVIANMRAERRRLAVRRRRWLWTIGLAGAAAMLVMAVWIAATPETQNQAVLTDRPSPAIAKAAPNMAQHPSSDVPHVAKSDHVRRVHHHRRRRQKSRLMRASYKERREQFPSPSPLTDQEKILQRYVQHYKEDAILTARAQTELAKQQEKENAATSQSSDNDKP